MSHRWVLGWEVKTRYSDGWEKGMGSDRGGRKRDRGGRVKR